MTQRTVLSVIPGTPHSDTPVSVFVLSVVTAPYLPPPRPPVSGGSGLCAIQEKDLSEARTGGECIVGSFISVELTPELEVPFPSVPPGEHWSVPSQDEGYSRGRVSSHVRAVSSPAPAGLA